ncbi:MAG: hypothetical protein LQ338_004068 [Usnochroma carphineum]|nr:MAG: hypothetical protein LQ338_004068 [Usnochroma carphineum]
MAAENEDEYLVPLQDQRVFGAGIKRKKVVFVPSSKPDPPRSEAPKPGAGDRYLAIVLGKNGGSSRDQQVEQIQPALTNPELRNSSDALCEICKLPIVTDAVELDHTIIKPHETSLAHQVCLAHSHPPSHLDRSRQGLKYLSAYGWDPDARQGLGASGTGIRIPIKPKPKNDTLGLGLVAPSAASKVVKQPIQKLDAKKTREAEIQGRRDREKLRDMFYRSEEVEKYLRPGG